MASTSDNLVIRTVNLIKRYKGWVDRPARAKDLVIRVLRGRLERPTVITALDCVNLEIRRGESVGFIGPNGSGKSTLMAIIARVLRPTSGEVYVAGRVGVLLEVGAAFHPDLTAEENARLSAAIVGMTERQIRERIEAIFAFAELEDFRQMPVHTYSSGMLLRLGFSAAIHLDPDILLVDEALAVGDEHFQRKCYNWMEAHAARGQTLGLVSHDLAQIARICRRVIWLEHGRIVQDGPAEEVVAACLEAESRHQHRAGEDPRGAEWPVRGRYSG
jgi:ABC-type polysaccharide/polyol phosphate transport system ATPase subunit